MYQHGASASAFDELPRDQSSGAAARFFKLALIPYFGRSTDVACEITLSPKMEIWSSAKPGANSLFCEIQNIGITVSGFSLIGVLCSVKVRGFTLSSALSCVTVASPIGMRKCLLDKKTCSSSASQWQAQVKVG